MLCVYGFIVTIRQAHNREANWWLFPANAAASAPRAARGAWRRLQPIWLTMSSRKCRCAGGCCHSRFPCEDCLPFIPTCLRAIWREVVNPLRCAPTPSALRQAQDRLQPACKGALRDRGQAGAGTTVPLHYPPGDCRRSIECEPRRAGRTETEDGVARWHHSPPRWCLDRDCT